MKILIKKQEPNYVLSYVHINNGFSMAIKIKIKKIIMLLTSFISVQYLKKVKFSSNLKTLPILMSFIFIISVFPVMCNHGPFINNVVEFRFFSPQKSSISFNINVNFFVFIQSFFLYSFDPSL